MQSRFPALFALAALSLFALPAEGRHPVSAEHPRLFGTRAELQALAKERADAYERVAGAAREGDAGPWEKIVSLGLVAAVEGDRAPAAQAKEIALQMVDGPIRSGHVTFGADLACCAVAYDLGHEVWTDAERERLVRYINATVDANVESETHVFHNAWYGYKNWGIGMACYATYHENPRAAEILKTLEDDYRTRAAPALELAGDGGGWAEGYYIHYWLYEWLVFCETALRCEGVDYYALAPKFYRNRAVAAMFETLPGMSEYRSRRSIPMGDGGGRVFGGDRDKDLAARRILAGRFRDDPAHQAVHAFNETTPRTSVGAYAYKDFLWRDPSVKQGDLARFRLSHLSPGPGFVYARSDWNEDAVHFFFKCGDRFTAHQHLDVGHFLISRTTELAGDGGHYDDFATPHAVNYYVRTIAHNTILVRDPRETWPDIRGGKTTLNDGGQHHAWPHHNGAVGDPQQWLKDRALYDIADLTAFEDQGDYLYVAGDLTRAYAPGKVAAVTRQIVYLRPGTFVIFDRVAARDASYPKTWLLQAAKRPEERSPGLVVTSGGDRLFLQTLLPADAKVKLVNEADLYRFEGQEYPPNRDTGPAPECRIEVSPPKPAVADYFLHILTATPAATEDVPEGRLQETASEVRVEIGPAKLAFTKRALGGTIDLSGRRRALAKKLNP